MKLKRTLIPDLADHETFDQVSPNGKEKGARPGIPTCRGRIHLNSSSLRILFFSQIFSHTVFIVRNIWPNRVCLTLLFFGSPQFGEA